MSDTVMSDTVISEESPKLKTTIQMAKYVSILPKNKTSGYGPSERLEYDLNPENAFIDGKASYVVLEVENRSSFKSGSSLNVPYPCMPYAHLGGHAIFKDVKFEDLNGRQIERSEQYPLDVMMLKSYGLDDDEREVLAKVEGIQGNNPFDQKCLISSTASNKGYLRPFFDTDPSTGNFLDTCSNVASAITAQYCLPIHLGSFSNLDQAHEVLPNLPLKGTRLTFDLASGNEVFQTLSSQLYTGLNKKQAVSATSYLDGNITNADSFFGLSNVVCNTEYQPLSEFVYSVGQKVLIKDSTNTIEEHEIVNVEFNVGPNLDQVSIELDGNITGQTGTAQIKLSEPKYDYLITKCELRVLNVVPDMETIKQVAKQVQNVGYNITSISNSKLSRVANLKETILDLPVNFKRALSIMIAPVRSDLINLSDWKSVDNGQGGFNGLAYPFYNINVPISYQYQLKNILTPDRPITYISNDSILSDNVLHFNNISQALSPLMNVKTLGNSKYDAFFNPIVRDLSCPFFFPLKLAPKGLSLDLLNIEPQLRISVNDPSDSPNILFYIKTIHTRRIQSSENLPVNVDV